MGGDFSVSGVAGNFLCRRLFGGSHLSAWPKGFASRISRRGERLCSTETKAISFIRQRIAKGTTVNADEAASWDALHDRFEMKRINHEEAYSMDGACTNWAEEFFSRMRRAEIGHHHHISGNYLLRYAQEATWREDNRRVSNGDQVQRVAGLAMKRGKSVDFAGYWQRHISE